MNPRTRIFGPVTRAKSSDFMKIISLAQKYYKEVVVCISKGDTVIVITGKSKGEKVK